MPSLRSGRDGGSRNCGWVDFGVAREAWNRAGMRHSAPENQGRVVHASVSRSRLRHAQSTVSSFGQCEDQPAELRILSADALLTGIPTPVVLAACGSPGAASARLLHDRLVDSQSLDRLRRALDTSDRLQCSLVDGVRSRIMCPSAQPARSGVAQSHALIVRSDLQRHEPAPSLGPRFPPDLRRSWSSASSIHSRAREA